ncbi:MAG: alanine racemase, partial [candidate division KSB1 bacterium]|nr:alanine racemase [candidate division KSB1 bacterium]
EALATEARARGSTARVHIKVDTGMGRVGVGWEQAVPFIQEACRTPGIAVEGIYTHLATADERDKSFAREQLARFGRVLQRLEQIGIRGLLRHAANSGAILDLPEAYFDLVRPGVSLYGYYPSTETSESIPLRPAMTFKTRVAFVKDVPAGTPLSYGRTFVTDRPTRIATLPVGYADGYNRLLSNRGEVLIGGRRYPVVGRVCMDQILVDVGPNGPVQVGDEAILFGRQGQEEISVRSLCEKLNTIPYEITCWVSKRVPRVYVDDGGQSEGAERPDTREQG